MIKDCNQKPAESRHSLQDGRENQSKNINMLVVPLENVIKLDDRYVYSLSGTPYERVRARNISHHATRRLPFIKKVMRRGRPYLYFVQPGTDKQVVRRLPDERDVGFDHAYLCALADLEGQSQPKFRYADKTSVYFVGCSHSIKIGSAINVGKRFTDLQACSPIPIEILATTSGGMKQERAYHRQFAAHRLHGEWFAPHPDILAEIDRLKEAENG